MKALPIILILFAFVIGCTSAPIVTGSPSNTESAPTSVITPIRQTVMPSLTETPRVVPVSPIAQATLFPTLPPLPDKTSTPSAELQALFAQAQTAASTGDYETGLMTLTRAIAADSGSAEAYNRRAGVYLELGYFPQALADYDRAIVLDPKNPYFYSNRAAVSLNQEDYSQALTDYNTALSLDPAASAILTYRGWAYFKAGNLAKASADYDKAVELSPESGFVFARRAWFHSKQGKVAEAYADYDHALTVDPKNAGWLSLRAFESFRMDNTVQAIGDFKRALEIDAESGTALNNLCWTISLGLKWQDTASSEICQKAVEKDTRNGNFRDSRGLARALHGDVEGAIADFQDFVEWSKRHGMYTEYGKKREQWIIALQGGRNPFDTSVLRALRDE